ncbi:MAG: hypothetical protein C3F15_09700 [Holophagae bacterium]|nr:MAG: hypothetical protein C3F15_09700 [Holophagae bacterium]
MGLDTRRSVGGPLAIVLTGLVALAAPATADISGFVVEEGTGAPIAGARVHVQADPASPVVVTAADGSFILPVSPPGMVMVTAGREYDRTAGANFATGGVLVSDGQTGVTISLLRLPVAEDPTYQSFLPQVADCGNCHEEQEAEWRLSNHASAGEDAWVRDLFSGDGTAGGGAGYVFLDTHDPGETGFCATCHTPMADVFSPGNVMLNEVTSTAALEGISCIACHQMDSVNDNVQALHLLGNATYRFPDGRPFIPTQEFVWGPLDDIAFGGMKPSYAPLFSDSLLCASCHEYNRPGTAIPGQTTYTEWLASPYAVPGAGFRSCQDCHMPEEDAPGYLVDPIGNPPLRPAEQIHEHEFEGAAPDELEEHVHLATTVAEVGSGIAVRCEVTNETGHAFPTGVSARNALVVIEVTWQGQPLHQTSGSTIPFWGSDDVPGVQDGDYAGLPGAGFARVLEGRINDQGPVVRPVLFIDGEAVYQDTLIPSGATDVTEVVLAVPAAAQSGDEVVVEARLLYRRAWRALAVTKGWQTTPQGGPIEIEVARTVDTVTLTQGGAGIPIPATGPLAAALLIVLIAAVAVALLRGRW